MASKERWTVGGADPSGNSWDILRTASPFEALKKLNDLRLEADQPGSGKSNRTYFVYDAEEPERGDAQMLLEEMLDEELEAAKTEEELAERDRKYREAGMEPWNPMGDCLGVGRNVLTTPAEPAEDFDDSDPSGIEETREETRDEQIARWEKEGFLDPSCAFCQREFYSHPGMPANKFAPNHRSNEWCKSGKHPHCTCDSCF